MVRKASNPLGSGPLEIRAAKAATNRDDASAALTARGTRRRQRPPLTTAIRQAIKAGVTVVAADLRPDGSLSLKFGTANGTAQIEETPEELRKLI